MPKAIIIGATSGIGKELAKEMSLAGYELGLTGRRFDILQSLKNEQGGKVVIRQMDVMELEASRLILKEMIDELGGMDIIVLNAGIGYRKPTYKQEIDTMQTNVVGFVNLADLALEYFVNAGKGQMVGVSSVISQRGAYTATTYAATKAFISSYLQGLRHRMKREKRNIAITDIRPGYIRTELVDGNRKMFWLMDAAPAAQIILQAIEKKKSVAYVPRKWRIIGWLLRNVPEWLAHKK